MFRARLEITAWVTLYLIKTGQQNKIIKIFKERGIFRSHANYIAAWHKDKRDTAFKKRIHQEVLDEVDRFLRDKKGRK